MVAVAWAVVGGPRTLHFFFAQLAELARDPEDPMRLGDDFLFTLALRSLVDPGHHARHNLPHDFFLRRENQMVYEELVDYLLQQTPPPVSGVAALLEGLKQVSPQLYERLLRKCGPYLSPEAACDRGDHAEAVRLLRGVAGFTCRPQDYVASLRSCFANDNVDVLVAAMDTLACIDCSVQGVTELQKLGLNSPSDPEIRIAAYRGLVHCIPVQPQLLNTVAKALNSEDVDYSPQVASYVWSHVQSVLSSDDPTLMNLRDLLTTADISQVPDPVWYDPRQHSRHMARTVHLDARTALTLAGDLVWGRYSPAPRALYLNLALHHDGHTHQMAQVVVRVTGLEAMLLSIPGVEHLMEASTVAAANLWSTLTRLARPSLRNKREISHDQIVEFIQQVMSRIPVGYRMGSSSLEVSLRLLGTHALHVRLANFRYSSPFSALADMLQPPLHAALAVFAPLLDNTLTMVTSSGVPVALRLTGVGGLQTLANHNTRQNGGIFNLMASGGMWVGARLEVGQQRDAALNSHLLWSSDVPINADYEYEGEAIQVSFRVPDDWTGLLWQRRRDTSIVDNTLELRVTQDCLGSGGPVELCLETCTSENEALGGSVRGPDGWLASYAHSVTLHLPPGEPIIITTSNPNSTCLIIIISPVISIQY
ncbi:uncharacterized protein LOC121861588 isoform X1 [Homarus americanus]|uniref:uncharacterized protein LOC121861588 isoform X1 n=1 Tax=Homarus americanus TaxID=6706 RepID=UPI001C4477D0|nr:uncharacterized protein LOC121861588 isoform X1 [Homarus americanus]